jgi:hypothetical protein
MKPDKPMQPDPNQGEGDRISARHYNQQLRDFVATGKVDPAAHEAEAYVLREPQEAARAERVAKRGPHAGISLDEMIAKGHTVFERVRPVVDRAVSRLRARFSRK